MLEVVGCYICNVDMYKEDLYCQLNGHFIKPIADPSNAHSPRRDSLTISTLLKNKSSKVVKQRDNDNTGESPLTFNGLRDQFLRLAGGELKSVVNTAM